MQVDDPRIVEFDVRTDEMLVNMGPQHPSTHGVLRLVLRTDGEIVSEVTPHIGYLHRCAEKIGENLTPRQWIPYTDRMDYLAGMNMNLGWSLCVEKLLEHELPEKGRHLRVIICRNGPDRQPPGRHGRLRARPGDLQPVSVRLSRAREDSRSVRRGLWRSADVQLPHAGRSHRRLAAAVGCKDAKQFLDQFEPVIAEYHTLLTTNAIFIKRTGGIGVLSPEMAIDYGCTGPGAARQRRRLRPAARR